MQTKVKVSVKDIRKVADTLQLRVVVRKQKFGFIQIDAEHQQDITNIVESLNGAGFYAIVDTVNTKRAFLSDVPWKAN